MKNYTLFQNNLSFEQKKKLNTIENQDDWMKVDFYKRYMNAKFRGSDITEFLVPVAEVQARDLEHAFEVGNIGPEDNIKRTSVPMYSISVGDVLYDQDAKEYHRVDSFGFSQVDNSLMEG